MKRASLLLALILLACLFSPAAMAATSGSCGTNITWRYTSSNKTLTFTCTGEGQMNDYSSYSAVPWYQYRNSIDHVVMTGYVTYIGKNNFYGIVGADFTLPETITDIAEAAFYKCNIRSIDLPALLTSIGTSVFELATFEHELIIPEGVETIGYRAFYSANIPSLTLPTSLRTISRNAFTMLYGPTSLELPESVTYLGSNAFYGCNTLTEVTIPATINDLNTAFGNCNSLEAFHIAPGNETYCDIDGVLFNKEATILLQYPVAKQDEHYDVPSSVTELDSYSFSYSRHLKSVTLPETVASIGQYAFNKCPDDLTLCVVAGSPAYDYALENSLAVEIISPFGHADLVLPGDLTAIEDEAFMGTDAAVVYIPAGVTAIGSRAFADCPRLKHINLPEGAALAGDAFDGCGMVYLYGISGGSAETYAAGHDNVTFVPLGSD